MKKKLLFISFPLFLTFILFIPYISWLYLNSRPNTYVENVSWQSINCIKFSGLTYSTDSYDLSSAKGKICPFSKSVMIYSGYVHVRNLPRNKRTNTSGWTITAENLSTEYKSIKANVNMSSGSICGKDIIADIFYHIPIHIFVDKACYYKQTLSFSSGTISAQQYSVPFSQGEYKHKVLSVNSVGPVYGITIRNASVYLDKRQINTDVRVDNHLGYKNPIEIRGLSVAQTGQQVEVVFRNKVSVQIDLDKREVAGQASCQDWVGILPEEVLNRQIGGEESFRELRFSGDLGFVVGLDKVKLSMGCKAVGKPPKFISNLRKRFEYSVKNGEHTEDRDRIAGPCVAGWTGLSNISSTMPLAVVTTEDPGFWQHRGVLPLALENSLKENIRQGKIVRGGSTLTMQLAKNLWLNRDRTIGRKILELLLTVELESYLTKEEIMELYLNVVEFGPDIYGIKEAANRILNKSPNNINLVEALYLALRLPAPTKAGHINGYLGIINRLMDNIIKAGEVPSELIELERQRINDYSNIGTNNRKKVVVES